MTTTVSEEVYKCSIRSQAMKAYHAKRRRNAILEEQVQPVTPMNLDYDRIINKWSQDPFVAFPVELTPQIRELLHNGKLYHLPSAGHE